MADTDEQIERIIRGKPYYLCRRDGCSVFHRIGGRMTDNCIDAGMEKENDKYLAQEIQALIANERREAEERGAAKAVAVINNELGLELNPRGSYYVAQLQPTEEYKSPRPQANPTRGIYEAHDE